MRYLRYLRFATYGLVLAIAILLIPRRHFIPLSLVPDPDRPDSADAIEQREIEEYNAALARLPKFDADRLHHILVVLRTIKYPITFDELRTRLGGPSSLVWCCTSDHLGQKSLKSTSTYHVASAPSDYLLVVDFASRPYDKRSSVVVRARLRYESPFGWGFAAESEEDYLHLNTPDSPAH